MSAANISGAVRFASADPISGDVAFNGIPLDVMGQMANVLQGVNADAGISIVFDHFLRWPGPISETVPATGGWLLTAGTGAGTVVETNVRGGEIALTVDATAGGNPTLQLGNTTAHMPFRYVVGKRMWCFARLKILTVASTEVFFGFCTADTAPCVTSTFPSDGIFFEKASTATKFDFHARQDGTSTETTGVGSTLVDDTYTIIGFTVDALGNIQPYQGATAVSALATGAVAVANANIPDAAGDTLTFEVALLGNAMSVTLDWILLAQEN
jgi:hypothetical protein